MSETTIKKKKLIKVKKLMETKKNDDSPDVKVNLTNKSVEKKDVLNKNIDKFVNDNNSDISLITAIDDLYWIPDKNDKNWKNIKFERKGKEKDKIIKFECEKYDNPPNLKITINQSLIDEVDIKETNIDHTSDKIVYYIIKFQKDDKSVTVEGKTPVKTFIQKKIKNRIAAKSNELNNFKDIVGVECTLVGCYLGKLVSSDLDYLKKIHSDEKTLFSVYKNCMYDIIQTEIKECEKDKISNNLILQVYYVYRIYIDGKDKQQYIFGSYNIIEQKDIKKILKNNCENIDFETENLSIELLKKIECYLECYGKIYVDEFIDAQNSIANGLNKFYNVVDPDVNKNNVNEINNKSFLLVQKDIMNKFWNNDLLKTKKGYVASLKFPENKNYIFSERDLNIFEKMNHYYTMRNIQNDDKRMFDMLNKTRYFNIKIELLANDLTVSKIQRTLQEIINKYPKSQILNGVEEKQSLINKKFFYMKKK